MADAKVAMLAGTTGLVGGFLLEALLNAADYSRVYAITRRPTSREHPRLANRIVNFDRLETDLKGLAAQDAFCCLGTTIAAAGSEAAFRQVDIDYVMAFARAAKNAGVARFVVVTSVGADPASKNFYLRTKGELETLLSRVGFQSLDIIQPGLLLGGARRCARLKCCGAYSCRLAICSCSASARLIGRGGADCGASNARRCAQREAWRVSLHLPRNLAARGATPAS